MPKKAKSTPEKLADTEAPATPDFYEENAEDENSEQLQNNNNRRGPGGPGRGSEKPKNFGRSLLRLLKELKNFKIQIIVAIILAIGGSVFSIIAPNKLSDLTDEITDGLIPNTSNFAELARYPEAAELFQKYQSGASADELYAEIDQLPTEAYDLIKPQMDFGAIGSIAAFLVVLYIVSSVFDLIESLLVSITTNKFACELRGRISRKINKLPLKYFDRHRIGDTLSRVTNDIDTITTSLNQSLSSLVAAVALFIGVTIMMFVTNWTMALAAIISSLLGFIFMAVVLSRSQKYFQMRQKELGRLTSHVEETYAGLLVVKAYNGKSASNREFAKRNQKVAFASQKSQFLSGLMGPMMGFIGNFGYVAVCVVGALLVHDGTITFGVIIAFMMYVRLFTSPLSQIAQSFTSLQSACAASERVFEFIDETEMPPETVTATLKPAKARGAIEFDHVSFGYDPGKVIIKDFTAAAQPGQKVAIVGPTGAGKTTMINLLMKFYDLEKGDIRIDGVSTKDLSRANVHELFTMVLQDTWLFDGTVRENIVYNRHDVSDKKVMQVCKTVGIDHFIKTLPKGLDSKLSESDSVSAGQKQLLTIARGMLNDAPFLILDEATSNVDTRTEELVQKAMDKLTEGRTSFIIAHRLSTIKNADLILVMKDGNIIEQGNHAELMQQNGFYADLYNSQFAL